MKRHSGKNVFEHHDEKIAKKEVDDAHRQPAKPELQMHPPEEVELHPFEDTDGLD